MKIGSYYLGSGKCEFIVWAPFMKMVNLKIIYPIEHIIPMDKDNKGYWHVIADHVFPEALYEYELNGAITRPDPASFFQPVGVHGTSQVIDHAEFEWKDSNWQGLELEKMIIYELHTGAFTPDGTFEAIIPRLNDLETLGVNAIEIMPVGQFPGKRNWGYDGVYLFAVQNSYGGPLGLKKLIDACHRHGFAFILDVVYNHIGPEGNYLADFGPYFTDKYNTPWGNAVNFDGAYSDEVRNFVLQNTRYWFEYYHVDALRLDAVHGIYDMSVRHILEELADETEEFSNKQGRRYYLIAESDLNDTRIIRRKAQGGYGIDAQWCDDFHHAVHTNLTGENKGYYADFGKLEDMRKTLNESFIYSGQYSEYRKRRHGQSSVDSPASQFVAFIQNHDQVGNRMLGERLSQLVSFEALKLAAGILFASPYIPLIFMGEEYAEETPFQYFVNHSDEDLIRAVRDGRRQEFMSFGWAGTPPDPQSEATFLRSRIDWELRNNGKHKAMLSYYRELMRLRKTIPVLAQPNKNNLKVLIDNPKKCLILQRWHANSQILSIINFGADEASIEIKDIKGGWRQLLDSADTTWLGPGIRAPRILNFPAEIRIAPYNFLLYEPGDKY